MTVYVGLDVHRKRTQVAILDEEGEQVLNRSVASQPGELMPILGTLDPRTGVAFEATYGWSWLAELLDDIGLEAHLVHPSRCKAIASGRLKTDKVDARTLAQLLRADLLPEAWIAPTAVRELRTLCRYRIALVRQRSSHQSRVHATLADRGIALPFDDLWTKKGRAWLETVELLPAKTTVLRQSCALIDGLNLAIDDLERVLRSAVKPDQRMDALMKLPGVGFFTALMLVAEIGDISRFASARKLCAWAGLTPIVRNSASTVRHGHISKEGSTWLRWALVESAQVAKRMPPFLGPYVSIMRRRGKNIATVAIARRLLATCFHVLKEVNQTNTRQTNTEQINASGELDPGHGRS